MIQIRLTHLIALIGLFVVLYLLTALSDIMLPFVLGFALAYFLDPLADRLEALGMRRSLAGLYQRCTDLAIGSKRRQRAERIGRRHGRDAFVRPTKHRFQHAADRTFVYQSSGADVHHADCRHIYAQ